MFTASLIICIAAGIVAIYLLIIQLFAPTSPKAKPHPNKCDCKDVNQCDKWCNAKILFTKYH